MKKNIIVLVSEIANDYTYAVLDGINDYFADKDVNLITMPTRRGNDIASKQYWCEMKCAASQQVDGVIVLSAVYLSAITKEELAAQLSTFHTDNIVSISADLPLKNSVYTRCSCESAYDEIITHLKEKHGCKNIAFMSALGTGSEEAQERYDAFLKALKKNGLKFNKKHLFDGYFVYDQAYNALLEKYNKKEAVDFDAVVAANDMMAFAVITALDSIGVNVPADVKVVGYDDIIQAQTAELTLSTVNQQMNEQGRTAAELVYKKANGQKISKETVISIKPIFRNSCGCNSKESDFLEKMKQRTGSKNMSVSLHLEKNMIQQNIYYLLETLQNETKLDELFDKFDTILPEREVPGIAICMYDRPVRIHTDREFELPERATVKLYIDKTCGIKETNIHDSFDPSKMIIPERYFGEKPGSFMTQPIFFGNIQYGYFVSKTNSREYLFTMIYQKTFSTIISQSYIYTKQLEENAKLTSENQMLMLDNTELNEISMIDSLTGIFNRRGLMEMGRESLNLSLKMGTKGVVFFADMDYLKRINDNYGHEMGDKAIQAEAEVFKTTFRHNDVIGRLGGDEFAGVIPGLPVDHIEKTRNSINEACKIISRRENFPFDIEISFGAVEFNSENNNLEDLIKQADKEQYKEKQKHHGQKKAAEAKQ
ncbi:MAG: GGDEF domain-containing protein [Treponema sp.]|nr:GGDEF domain-containing protein [Treponema sp.]